MNAYEYFVVKHYSEDEYPIIKGNGFDGTIVGETRKDAEKFIDFVNNMLRQQADRIAELEKDNKAFVKIASDEHKIAVKQEQRVLELEKQIKDALEIGIAEGFLRAHKTSAEPVAWINRHMDDGWLSWDRDSTANVSTPLYTTLAEQVSWKDIENYEEFYEVSSNGDIRNKNTGKILAKSLMGAGYVKADLWKDNKRWQTSVHRIVAQAFIENINEYEEVNHINGIKTDNRAENLEWVTRSENCNHSLYELGNRIKGVFARNLKTGETRTYPSVSSTEKHGFEPKNVSEVCRLDNRYSHKGWTFSFIEETPQTKPLSDEEIISSAEKAGFNWSEDKGIFVKHSNGSWIGLDAKVVYLVRAIEERILGK